MPWDKHIENHASLSQPNSSGEQASDEPAPYGQEAVLEYLQMCKAIVEEKTARFDPDAESGFHWLPFGKLELQLYNLRHLQHHTGELCERLGTEANIEVEWQGMARDR